jgi:glycosyltransferase involved in cell wall biosynthesis
MRVVMTVGSFPPRGCGAEDYAALLADVLGQIGADIRIVAAGKHDLLCLRSLVQEILRLRPAIVHIQYPTTGYRKSLVPQALSMVMANVPVVTTVHEFSQAHFLRQASNLPFALGSQALVFTTEYERQSFLSWFPWVEKRTRIIPIASNISLLMGTVERDPLKVVHFGLIRPEKGLEDFLKLAKLARDAGRPYRFTVVGEPVARFGPYLKNLKKDTDDLPVEWKIGLPAEEVARCLAGSRFAYVPFPDGASERRASLLAVLGNGAVVITTQGSQTPKELEKVVRFATSPPRALELLDELVLDVEQADALSSKAREYASRFTWRSISKAHFQLYEQILNGHFGRLGRKSKDR